MKQIRLKNQIKIIESCTALNCPCYECFVDTGNLGATIKVDDNGWPTEEGVFPVDCPLEDAA